MRKHEGRSEEWCGGLETEAQTLQQGSALGGRSAEAGSDALCRVEAPTATVKVPKQTSRRHREGLSLARQASPPNCT